MAGGLISSALSSNPFYTMGRFRTFSNARLRKREGIGVCFQVGTADAMDLPFSSTRPLDFDNLSSDIPELLNYHTSRSEDAEHIFIENCKSVRNENEVNLLYQTLASELMSELYPSVEPPEWAFRGLSPLDIVSVIINVDPTKNPGFPMNSKYYSKGDVLNKYLPELYEAILVRLVCLRYCAPHCETILDFFNCFCADMYGVSTKNEVLKSSKMGRNIISVGYLSQCVERLLYDAHSTWFKDSRFEYNSAIGIGFDRLTSDILNTRFPDGVFKQDVPTWDYTVTAPELMRRAQRVANQYRVPPGNPLRVWLVQHERSNVHKFYVMPNGRVYVAKFPGQQATGRDQTAGGNTDIRNERAYAAAIYANLNLAENLFVTNPLSAGDDNLDDKNELLTQAYEAMGLPLREAEYTNIVDFCSHFWPKGETPLGQRIFKGAYKLLMEFDIDETAGVSFVEEYCNHPEFPALISRISEHRPEMNTILRMHSQLKERLNDHQGILVLPMRRRAGKPGEVFQRPIVAITHSDPSQTTPALATSCDAPDIPQILCRRRRKAAAPVTVTVQAPKTGPTPASGQQQRRGRRNRRKRNRGPRNQPRGGINSTQAAEISHTICSLSNPFCMAARGARIPDNSFQKSIGWYVPGEGTTISTDVSGQLAIYVTASPYNQLFSGTISAGTATFAGAPIPIFTPPGSMARWRVVTAGLKLSCSTPLLTTQGMVKIRLFSGLTGASNTRSTSNFDCDETVEFPLTRLIEKDYKIILKPIGEKAHDYVGTTTAYASLGAFVNNELYQQAMILVSGGVASTGVLKVDYFYNYEYVPSAGSSDEKFAQPPPVSNSAIREAVAHVQTSTPSFLDQADAAVDRIFSSTAIRLAAKVGQLAFGAATRGPAGAASLLISN